MRFFYTFEVEIRALTKLHNDHRLGLNPINPGLANAVFKSYNNKMIWIQVHAESA